MGQIAIRTIGVVATEINIIKEQTRTMLIQNSIEIGKRLVEAKEMVPHGQWRDWLKDNVDYSQSTANNLMKIYSEFGQGLLSLESGDPKSQALADLTYTQALALAGVPADIREEIIEEHDLKELSSRELQQVIKEKKELEKRLKASEKAAEQERAEKEKLAKKQNELEEARKNHEQLIEGLKREIQQVQAFGNDEEAARLQESLNASKEELEDYKKRIKQLETELKQQPIEVAATTTIEVVPEEVKQELNELRKKVGELEEQSNVPVVKFKYCFETLVTNFNDILTALDEIKAADPEGYKEYNSAVKALFDRMQAEIE